VARSTNTRRRHKMMEVVLLVFGVLTLAALFRVVHVVGNIEHLLKRWMETH